MLLSRLTFDFNWRPRGTSIVRAPNVENALKPIPLIPEKTDISDLFVYLQPQFTAITMASPSPSTWHSITPSTRPLSLSILELTPLALTLSLTLASPSTSTSASGSHSASNTHLHPQSPAVHSHRRKKRHHHNNNRTRDSDDDTAVEMDDSDIIPGAWPVLNGQVRFKDLLSHGVVVSVNGQPWNRIVAHVSDADEEDEEDVDADDEEEQWDDEHAGGGEANGEEGNMTRRRPRRARFTLSAGNAAREAGIANKRRKEKKSQGDRAVVVVYGLSPGKEYEIELRVVGMFGEGVDGIGASFCLTFTPKPC